MAEKTAKKSRQGSWFLHRGESFVASTGLTLAIILLGAMAGAGWWTLRTQRSAMVSARSAEVETVGTLLSHSAESMMSLNELSAVRRLLVEAGVEHELTECRIVLPDGQVVADLDTSFITTQILPDEWEGEVSQASVLSTKDHAITVSYPMKIPGRGAARLEIVAPVVIGPWEYWEAQAGVGAIGATGLFALLFVYRRMRSKLRALGAIRESLVAMALGESSSAALTVNESLGPEAVAWNQLLAEKDEQRNELLSSRARGPGGLRREGLADLEGACDAMWHGLLLVDGQLRAKYANGAAAVLLKSPRDKILGADISQLITDQEVQDSIRSVANGTLRRRSTIEVEQSGDEGSGVLRFSVRPVRRGDAASAMVVIEDITQQRLAENARNAFVAQATHELRTPLTNIRLYAETAIEDGENDPAMQAKSLNVINQESRRLERIVGDMLSVSEIEAGTFKLRQGDVRLETLFEEIKADYEAQAIDKGLALTFNLPPKFPVIQGDRDKLVLAVHNLIGNALKYTPKGGAVTVNMDVEGDRVVIEVVDTGIGISAEEYSLVFDRFYRAKDKRVGDITGSGLGLALAREVVRMHGGDIAVESEIDHGSTFTLTLPMLAEAA